MLRSRAAGGAAGALLVLGTAVAGAQEDEASVRDARQVVEAHQRRLEKDIADLRAIRGAQAMLTRYFELGGGREGERLDQRLCRGSALRALCPSLSATFGETAE